MIVSESAAGDAADTGDPALPPGGLREGPPAGYSGLMIAMPDVTAAKPTGQGAHADA